MCSQRWEALSVSKCREDGLKEHSLAGGRAASAAMSWGVWRKVLNEATREKHKGCKGTEWP